MFDYLIQNGTLIDGTGAPAAAADVAIKDGKIAAVGDLKDASAGTVLDAAGKYVTPGFIDIHRHADAALFRPHFGELELKQGLTTIVNGNCGLSVTPCAGAYKRDRGISDPGCGRAAGERRFFQPRFLSVRCKKDPQPHQHRHAGGQRHHPRLRGRLRHARA
ncbi:MAG: amidohydrolase family protein [Oscillospiraceae bacterium]